MSSGDRSDAVRRVVTRVAALNLAYFGIEFAVAVAIGSVSLFADSIDILEDASVNFLIAVALGWNPVRRARVGMGLAAILLVPAVATLWAAWTKLASQVPPPPVALTLTGLGALVVKPRRTPRSHRPKANEDDSGTARASERPRS